MDGVLTFFGNNSQGQLAEIAVISLPPVWTSPTTFTVEAQGYMTLAFPDAAIEKGGQHWIAVAELSAAAFASHHCGISANTPQPRYSRV